VAIDAPLARAASVGRDLARLILPPEVFRLLGESLSAVAARPDLGLRIRLCLDEDLIDLPWEYLYRPDVEAPAAQSGFLLTDGRISITREPPAMAAVQAANDRVQHALFVGTKWDDGSDGWSVASEYASLRKAMKPVGKLLEFEFADANDVTAVERDLRAGCDVFHYAGHTDITDGRGSLVHLASAAALSDFEQSVGARSVPVRLEARAQPAEWSASEVLGDLLAGGGTRLAVFNACNSGLWPFVRPLMRAGVPAVVGVQGLVSNLAALHFAEKFYQSLAVGLSLDEALTYARLYVLQPGRSYYPCDWGRFMAYLQTDSAVLFPRVQAGAMHKRQEDVRAGRRDALGAVPALVEKLDGERVSRLLSEVAARSVLILGRFSEKRKPVLDLIRRELSTERRQYVPILFDFDRPQERTMLEAVLRFAAVSRFVIADLSDAKWVLAECDRIATNFRSLPIIPIMQAALDDPYAIEHVEGFQSASKVVRYQSESHLRSVLGSTILPAGERLYAKLMPRAVLS
jgi:hypothetical protein